MPIPRSRKITEDISYIYHEHHRNNNPNKSQWVITIDQETDCFISSHQIKDKFTVHSGICWGLYLEEDECQYLGKAARHSTEPNSQLFIAKFIDNSNEWHGYPADHVDKFPEDVPHEVWLNYWLQKGLLSKSKVSKILRGRKCKL